jgi:hypothetical protein
VAAPVPPQDDAKRAELAAMAEQFAKQNHFEILGVPETAGNKEI